MKIKSYKLLFFTMALFLAGQTMGQTSLEGDALPGFLGKAADSPELKDLKATYNFEMANETHYLSKKGIELILQKGALAEIHLYKSSVVYGSYTGALPKKLKFGMSSGEIKQLLGKPAESYSSGYCEFDLGTYIISCWLEAGRLNQVALALK